jgi:3-hydroxybutyryl-CoA dehydrogenase
MEIKTFGVIGAGQMGGGIAQVAAMSGLDVVMNDIKTEFVEKGIATITKILSRGVEKEKMSEDDKTAILGRIKASVNLQDMASADFVVEAATENEEIKYQLFKDLDGICGDQVILATNTSSIPIGRIAAHTARPEKIIGMHFMNPVPVMKLVEVIPGIATSDETFQTTWNLAENACKSKRLSRLYCQSNFITDDQRGGLLPLPRCRQPRRH